MVTENNKRVYSFNFWGHWYFIALVLSPLICFVDYYTAKQGFGRIYGSSIVVLALMLLLGRGTQNVIFRNYLPVGILLALYFMTWDLVLWKDTIARKGIFYEFFLNRTLQTVAVLFVVDNLRFSEKLIETLVRLMKGLIVLGALVSLLQVIYDPFFFTPAKFKESMLHYDWGTNVLQVRRLSIFGFTDVNDVGLSFLPIVALVVGYEIKEKNRIPVLILILSFFIAVVNNSRYIQLGFFIAAAPALFYQKRIIRNSIVAIIGFAVLALMMGLVLQLVGYDVSQYIDERLLDEAGGNTRLLAFEIFGLFFPDNPFFGTGQHLTEDVLVAIANRSSQIHVGYLSLLFSYGIVGTSIAVLFWGLITARLWAVAKKSGFYGSFFGFMVFWWANVTMVYYWIFTFGLILCYLFASYYGSKEESV
ncbi:O-antigen ligase family protein [Thermophagus sp. OGC60D27]|uniref:O-antigen ligase family protein n=1 Tax=Thermophagus sp. OGC60D27 TaxID=3458415 RepID=UPI004037C3C9